MKYAVVTGGTRGIGFAVCRLLSEKGYCVTALYSTEGADSEGAKRALPQVNFVCADVSDEEQVKRVFAQVEKIDVLVNNAGISLLRQIQDTSLSEWERIFAVNVRGAFLCSRYAAKKMISEQSGAIVNVSSVWGETGASCESAYSATKGAIIAFSKALAKELAPSNITVNCVTPGVIDTKMNAHFSAEERAALVEEIPLGRMGTAEEVAEAIVFLCESGYITGQVLGINGGFYV